MKACWKGHEKKEELLGSKETKWKNGKTIPFFFKINDLRELSISDSRALEKATEESNYEFQKFRWDNTKSPAYIREKPNYPNWFDGETRWWREVLNTSDDLDPGKFRTNAVKKVYYQALQYAAINRPILLVGQRGTGKTHLARFIRRNSQYCREKYSENWPLISCAEYGDPSNLQDRIFGEDGIRSERLWFLMILNTCPILSFGTSSTDLSKKQGTNYQAIHRPKRFG